RCRSAVMPCPLVACGVRVVPPVIQLPRLVSTCDSCIPWVPRIRDTAVRRMKHTPGVCRQQDWSPEAGGTDAIRILNCQPIERYYGLEECGLSRHRLDPNHLWHWTNHATSS